MAGLKTVIQNPNPDRSNTVPAKLIIEDDGWFDAVVKTDTGDVPIHLDVMKANNKFAALTEEHPDETARADAWVEWLVGEGVPRLTHGGALRLAEAVIADMRAFAERHPRPTPAS